MAADLQTAAPSLCASLAQKAGNSQAELRTSQTEPGRGSDSLTFDSKALMVSSSCEPGMGTSQLSRVCGGAWDKPLPPELGG